MLGKRRFSVAAPSVWNSLPLNLRTDYNSLRGFKTNLKTHFSAMGLYLASVSRSASDYSKYLNYGAIQIILLNLLTYLIRMGITCEEAKVAAQDRSSECLDITTVHQVKKDDVISFKNHVITAILYHWKYKVYDTAVSWSFWRFICGTKVKIYHFKTIWMGLCERSGYFLFLSTFLAGKRHANLFEADVLRSTVPFDQFFGSNFFTDDREQFLFVNSLITYFAPWPFLDARLIKILSLLKAIIVLLFILNNDMSMTSIYYSRLPWRLKHCLYRYLKQWYFFKLRFLHLRFILLCQILCTPFTLTEKCGTLVNINCGFILTQLLTMF